MNVGAPLNQMVKPGVKDLHVFLSFQELQSRHYRPVNQEKKTQDCKELFCVKTG